MFNDHISATAAAAKAFRIYGNDPRQMLVAAINGWYMQYPIENEPGFDSTADAFICERWDSLTQTVNIQQF